MGCAESNFQWREEGGRGLIGHKQSFDEFPLDDVTLHDFLHVRLGDDPVPHTFGVHDDARTLGAVVQTARLVRANDTFQVEPLGLLLKTSMQRFGPELGTAASRIVRIPFIRTDKNMSLVACHAVCSTIVRWDNV